MDNQNPMNGGMPQGQGQYGGQNTPPQNQNGNPQSSVVVQPGLDNLENVQTQSVVESAREEAEKELEQVRAYNEALVRQQKAQENATKAKKTSVTIFGVIIFIVLLGVIAWLVVNAIILAQGPAGPGKDSEVIDPAQLAEIDGYKCTTTNCAKVVDLPDGRIIIRDTAYYIYDLEEKEATLTSIEEKDYHAITPFYWGDRLLAELDPESDASALYSITENRALTSYNFDTIYRDINDDVYKNQTSIKGSYIIVKGSGNYRMINVATGTEVVRGTNKVYKYGNFFFGYENGNEVRAYNSSGRQIKIAYAKEDFYVKDGKYLVFIDKDGSYEIYDGISEDDIDEGALYDYLWDIDEEVMRATLNRNNTFYHISKNQQTLTTSAKKHTIEV